MKALENFKTGLNISLESGKSFAVAVRDNTESSFSEFEQGCAGKRPTLFMFYPTGFLKEYKKITLNMICSYNNCISVLLKNKMFRMVIFLQKYCVYMTIKL